MMSGITERTGCSYDTAYLWVSDSCEPAVITGPLSDRLSVEPFGITQIAAILVIIVSLINLCCFLRLFAIKCFKKCGADVEYRKVQWMASETDDEQEDEEQQMV